MKKFAMILMSATLATSALTGVAHAGNSTNVALTSALGSVVGTSVGRHIGGNSGALVGSAIGGGAGAAVSSNRHNRTSAAIGGAVVVQQVILSVKMSVALVVDWLAQA